MGSDRVQAECSSLGLQLPVLLGTLGRLLDPAQEQPTSIVIWG